MLAKAKMIYKNIKFMKIRQRKAISQVIGSLAMMAIVTAIGSVVLFQGLNGIQGFNNILTTFVSSNKFAASENILIEHVNFQTVAYGSCNTPPCVTIWLRNVGDTDAKIKTIKIIGMKSQTLILDEDTENIDVFVKSIASKMYVLPSLDETQNYRISITTEKDNSFTHMVTPYNG